ncbi:polysaccharide pyruvyl transferase family protein [Marivirga sp.]|uniref:polysaccharide pyruvyl transferase family protein n=1 Tax=Marivirga sp. TaxID=2018662 RepID=UPI003DA6EE38
MQIKKFLYHLKPSNLVDTIKSNISNDTLVVYWSHSKGGTKNFGDVLNKYLIEKISGKEVLNFKDFIFLRKSKERHSAIGSVLNQFEVDNLVIWGSGFIQKPKSLKFTVKEIRAVRGPLTKKIFEDNNIDCPSVFGDPAILLPNFFHPKVSKKHEYGIIPHYTDLDSDNLNSFVKNNNVKVIDVTSPIESLVTQLLECNHILSSSLHGIILADAYKIPNLWITINNRLVGGEFKFHDYFLSNNKDIYEPIQINADIELSNLKDKFREGKMSIDIDKLLEVCPFNK